MVVLLLTVNLYTDNQMTVGKKSVLKPCYGCYTGAGWGCCCIIGAGIEAKDYNLNLINYITIPFPAPNFAKQRT